MSDVSPMGSLTVSSAEITHQGLVREENQDSVRTATWLPLGQLFIVADGIGGYQGGAVASKMVVEGFIKELSIKQAGDNPDAALQEACTKTNHAIQAAASSGDPAKQRMGSTVVLALIQTASPSGPMAWIGHVGDSRAYLVRNGELQKITNDHSAVQALLSRNLITEEEARNHPDSSVLTRSLGHRSEVEIEIDHEPLLPGDALLLCSDGLWGYVDEAQIKSIVVNPEFSVQTIAEHLKDLALAAGGQDNIGIQFIRFTGTNSTVSAPLPASFLGGPAITAAYAEPRRMHRNKKLQIAAVALVLLGGLGGLGLTAFNHNWHGIADRIRGKYLSGPVPQNASKPGIFVGKPGQKLNTRGDESSVDWQFSTQELATVPHCNQDPHDHPLILVNEEQVKDKSLEGTILRHFSNEPRFDPRQVVIRAVPDTKRQACGAKGLEIVVLLPPVQAAKPQPAPNPPVTPNANSQTIVQPVAKPSQSGPSAPPGQPSNRPQQPRPQPQATGPIQ